VVFFSFLPTHLLVIEVEVEVAVVVAMTHGFVKDADGEHDFAVVRKDGEVSDFDLVRVDELFLLVALIGGEIQLVLPPFQNIRCFSFVK
jgi:hypothetical protein